MEQMDVTTAVDADRFRALMAGFPSGVAVLTTVDGDGVPLGLTCTSLCAVSLVPPLLLVCVDSRSRTLEAVRSMGLFAVNLLHRQGRPAAEVFSAHGADRFAAVEWSHTRAGLPCLTAHAHSVAECLVRSTTKAGDHTVVFAEVVGVEHLGTQSPLLYGLREYAAWPGGPADVTAVAR